MLGTPVSILNYDPVVLGNVTKFRCGKSAGKTLNARRKANTCAGRLLLGRICGRRRQLQRLLPAALGLSDRLESQPVLQHLPTRRSHPRVVQETPEVRHDETTKRRRLVLRG